MKPLRADVMADSCLELASRRPEVVLFDSIDSTNSWLLENGRAHADFTLCCTERQTAGKGRRGKTWLTPPGGITFSIQLTVPQPIGAISGLSLLVGAAVCRVLRRQRVADVMVKWPNDIYQRDRKLAGILLEVGRSDATSTTVVVGIGLNYRQGEERLGIDQPNVDLYTALNGTLPDRSTLIGQLAGEVAACTSTFTPESMRELADQWRQYDLLHHRHISISQPGDGKAGVALGIDTSGRLIVDTGDGVQKLSSGEISVKLDREIGKK